MAGNGTAQNKLKGVMLLTEAAGKGYEWAAYMLGGIFATGMHDIPVDLPEARRFLKMALSDSCTHKSLDETSKAKAQTKLDEISFP